MSLNVVFDVPELVAQGLNSGGLERIGGIIRDTKSKQIVAWLRETSAKTSENPISQLIRNSGLVHVAVVPVMPLINIGFTAISFAATMNQLHVLSEELNSLREMIQIEFWRDRDKDFEKALEAARNAFESNTENTVFQRDMASAAILELPKARNLFLDEFVRIANTSLPSRELMEHCLIRATHAHITLIKCLVLHDQLRLARERLKEGADRIRKAIQQLVQNWVSIPAALWFYQDVPLDITRRYVAVQRWLREPDDVSLMPEATVLWDVLNEARSGFWDNQLLQQLDDQFDDGIGGLSQRFTRTPKITRNQKLAQLALNIDHAETLIEIDQRLAGYGLELSSIRLSYSDWEGQIPLGTLEENGSALLVDTEYLEAVSKRMSS